MKKLLVVAGARPNFVKIAPFIKALRSSGKFSYKIVHTGQHYDTNMSQIFFDELEIPPPDYSLNVGSSSSSVQIANIMIKFEEVCLVEKPDLVVVVGDVNSTVACGLVAKKLNIKLAHIEAGLRSFDRSMPEEINRIITDSISDYLFVSEKSGLENLIQEGHPVSSMYHVGQIMADSLYHQMSNPKATLISDELRSKIGRSYAVLTMHRPSNVDDIPTLKRLMLCFKELCNKIPIVFPCHPRTLSKIKALGIEVDTWSCGKEVVGNFIITEPFGYRDFLNLWKGSVCVLTDSGGLQEETTILKIPCITFRETTERPVTVSVGSNVVVGTDTEKIEYFFNKAITGCWRASDVPELWDGKTSERIIAYL